MPIYAFICTACGHSFDRLQKLSDPDPAACAECGAEAIKRQLTAPSFRLSGGGWYETDFKKDGDRKRNLAGEGGEGAKPAAEANADSKPDTKPDAKPEAKSEGKPAEVKSAAKTAAKSEPAAAAPKPASGTP